MRDVREANDEERRAWLDEVAPIVRSKPFIASCPAETL
jgi:hypothetical protein